ncbi:MAG: DNA mismatch repair endonuclease MutL [Bacteroidota bacterium]
MSDVIRLLPDHVANQINAGEVVQRPASVVKELVENAIDAGATRIFLTVKEAGRSLIQVVDNGKGMNFNDALACFGRHATSKLRSTEDLYTIRTMGFRGEAMTSIAAVAQVELKTRMQPDELGTLVRIEGGEVKEHEPAACEPGTVISVRNLFFNVPARRNFLKSNSVEMRYILEEFQRLALAHPELHFRMQQNDLDPINFAAGKLSRRIVDIFGNSYREQLIACKEDTDQVNIMGYVGKPEHARKGKGEQYFFVNNRFIRSSYLHHAVLTAFDQMLQPETHPFYVLFLEVDPKHIDVNVHPAKTEIKFEDERSVYTILLTVIRRMLSMNNIAPSLDFDNIVQIPGLAEYETEQFRKRQPSDKDQVSKSFGSGERKVMSRMPGLAQDKREANNLNNWEKLYNPEQALQAFERKSPFSEAGNKAFSEPRIVMSGQRPAPGNTGVQGGFLPEAKEEQGPALAGDIVFLQAQGYVFTQVKSGMMMVNLQAAKERILYEKFLSAAEQHKGHSQQVLFPKTLELSRADFGAAVELQEEFAAFGFLFEVSGKQALVFRGIPADLSNTDERDLFAQVLHRLQEDKDTKVPKRERIALSLAKRVSMQGKAQHTQDELRELVNRLFSCRLPHNSPDGVPTISILDTQSLDEIFRSGKR